MNGDGHVRLGGLVVGHRLGALWSGLVWSQHWWGRRCWKGCFRRLSGAEAFLPDQHAHQEEGQSDADHGRRIGERPMSYCWFDLVEFFEQLAGVEFSVVLGPEPLDRLVDALGDGSAEQVRYLAGPVLGLSLNLDGLRFVR